MQDDYLKFWRVVRRWALLTYDINVPDLEMVLFLYSEKRFGQDDFDEYNQIFPWDKKRFQSMVTNGMIVKFRNQKNGKKALYTLSRSSVGMVKAIYAKLNGEETFSEHRTIAFKRKNPNYANKMYRNVMKNINKEIIEKKKNGG